MLYTWALQPVAFAHLWIFGRHEPCEVEKHLCLLPGGIILHLAFDHRRSSTIRHGRDDFRCERYFLWVGRKHGLSDVDLRRMQRPSAGAAHKECISELRFTGDRIREIAK